MKHEHDTQLPGDTEDPRGGPTWTIGIAGTIVLVVSLLVLTALYYQATRIEDDGKVIRTRSEEWNLVRAARADAHADQPHWETWKDDTGFEERTLVVPIEYGMAHVVATYGSGASGN